MEEKQKDISPTLISTLPVKSFFPLKGFTAVLIVTSIILIAWAWYIGDFYFQLEAIQKNYMRLGELTGEIARLDEVLTMSARMSAVTGERQWEERYHRFELDLDNIIKETFSIGKNINMQKAIAKTDTANTKLVAMEYHAFNLVHQGKKEDANSLLYSVEYETQKQIYRQGIEEAIASINKSFQNDIDRRGRHGIYVIVSIFLVVPGLIFSRQAARKAIQRYEAERSKAELALRESEERFRSLYENSMLGIYRTTPRGKILMANPAMCKMLGYSSLEELQHLDLESNSFQANYSREDFKKEIEKNGAVIGLESVWISKDGNKVYFRENAKAIKDNDGTVLYYEGTVEDITERKQVENQLRLLAYAIQGISECVSITDMEDNVIFVNDAFLKTYGYEENEIIGKPVSMVRSSQNNLDNTANILQNTISGGWRGELWNRRKDGTDFTIHLSSSIVRDDHGSPIALVGVANDITQRKQAELEREKLIRELQTALAEVKTLSGLLPICANCKKIRDDKGYWNQIEAYFGEKSDLQFTHGICPECMKVLYPNIKLKT
jgi:PAS domain S-box-containing protein